MVYYRLDPGRRKNPVQIFGHQVVDGDGGGNFMAQNHVYIQYNICRCWGIPQVGGKYFFCNGFSHRYTAPFVLISFIYNETGLLTILHKKVKLKNNTCGSIREIFFCLTGKGKGNTFSL